MKKPVYTILDCYTDEPAGLGVPPYLGTYPRYLAGKLHPEQVNYITIDDLRLVKNYHNRKPQNEIVTNIKIYNTTNQNIPDILDKTTHLVVIIGVQTPGKYLSAVPGTIKEVVALIEDLQCKKILTGPGIFGTQLIGGRKAEAVPAGVFHETWNAHYNFKEIKDYAIKGAYIVKSIPQKRIVEIETGRGCTFGKCSFCTEPIKNKVEFRDQEDVIEEVKLLHSLGCEFFRLGKATCTLSYKNGDVKELEKLLKPLAELNLKVLHIDNVNPVYVNEERVKLITKYCTDGNIAAFGVESFDKNVVRENTLNCTPENAYRAIKILNEFGSQRGPDGMPYFLPGINIILGLKGETKETLQENYKWLKKIYDDGLMIRRINIRQVTIFEGTMMNEVGYKYFKKNKRLYFSFRKKIREEIDLLMLQRVIPLGTILNDVYTETHQGNVTFARQYGTYPIIIGMKGRFPLGEKISVKVTGHMLRSITGEPVNPIQTIPLHPIERRIMK